MNALTSLRVVTRMRLLVASARQLETMQICRFRV